MKAANSSYISAEESEQIMGLLQEAGHWAVIENAGHGVFRDNPHEFLEALVPFLRSSATS